MKKHPWETPHCRKKRFSCNWEVFKSSPPFPNTLQQQFSKELLVQLLADFRFTHKLLTVQCDYSEAWKVSSKHTWIGSRLKTTQDSETGSIWIFSRWLLHFRSIFWRQHYVAHSTRLLRVWKMCYFLQRGLDINIMLLLVIHLKHLPA